MRWRAMASSQKYLVLFQFAFMHGLKNYKALVGLALFLIACLLIFAYLWDIAAARMGTLAFQADQLLWYSAFNQWILIAIPYSGPFRLDQKLVTLSL
jgi:ABC-2 type transport system permease protein